MFKKLGVAIIILIAMTTVVLARPNIAVHSDSEIGWSLYIYDTNNQYVHHYIGNGNQNFTYLPQSYSGYTAKLFRWGTVLDDEGIIPSGSGWLDLYIQVGLENPGEPPED